MPGVAWQEGSGCGQLSCMAKNTTRRSFLRTAPIAAAAGFTLADSLAAMAQAGAPGADVNAAAQPFKLWSAKELTTDIAALDAKPGDNRLYTSTVIPEQIILTVEKHKSAAEFEWHEGRDHLLYVLDGATVYEVGGTPTGTKVMPGQGEWHATGSTGEQVAGAEQGRHAADPARDTA